MIELNELKPTEELFEVRELKVPVFDDNGVEIAEPKFWFACNKKVSNMHFKCADKEAATELCLFLNNEVYINPDVAIDEFVIDNCIEWSNLINELSRKEIELYSKREAYEIKSETILDGAAKLKAETGEDIIKAKYGGNNDKTRKKYVKESLMLEKSEIKYLEWSIDYLKRRISYLKGLVHAKTAVLEVKAND